MKDINRNKKGISIILILLSAVFIFSSCSHSIRVVVRDDGVAYADKRTGIVYFYAGLDWEPAAIGEKYAVMDMEQVRMDVYHVEGLEPERWLATEDNDLFYAEGVSMPTLEELYPDTVDVMLYSGGKEIKAGTISGTADCALFLDDYLNGNEAMLWEEADTRFEIYLSSALYPGIRCHMIYLLVPEGAAIGTDAAGNEIQIKAVLYRLSDHKFIGFTEDILEKYGIRV